MKPNYIGTQISRNTEIILRGFFFFFFISPVNNSHDLQIYFVQRTNITTSFGGRHVMSLRR